MKKVYFFVSHTVPTEHPNGVRISNLGLIFKSLGYDVWLVGCDSKETRTIEYKNMHCKIFNQISGSGVITASKRSSAFLSNIKEFVMSNGNPDIIVSGLRNSKAQRFLIKHCKNNHIGMVQTVCEWFDRSAFVGIKGVPKFINDRYSLYFQYPKINNIITISTFHAEYYRNKGCNVVTIPTLVDMREYEGLDLSIPHEEKLKIVYAGSPAKKDYLANVIKSIDLLNESEQAKLEIHLYGCTEAGLSTLGFSEQYISSRSNVIFCHGKIPYDDVKKRITDADFTILLRPNKRYANAGFPTKVGESMACGTPVIANITSDLGKYILDEYNGIISDDETPEACARAIRRALMLNDIQLSQMRVAAIETAKSGFDVSNHIETAKHLINKI